MYGTGTSSDFTPQGQLGYILQSNGAAPPTWVMPSAVVASSNLTGSSVVQVANGNNRVVGLGGASVDVVGTTIGSVLYGTGASSAFTGAGTSGQYLKSNGAAAPTWSNGSNVTGSTVVAVTNGTGQGMGTSNMSIDVAGTNGGVMYGTGTSSNFTTAGLSGQVLMSTGAGAPTWGNIGANNGVHVTTPNVQLGGALTFDTDIPLSGHKMTFSGNTGNVGIGTTTPVSSAILDLSTTTMGFAPPRMTTTQRDAIAAPVAGLVIYNSTCDEINYYSNQNYWRAIVSKGAPVATNSTNVTTSSFQANWTAVTNATSYVIDVATDVNFTSMVAGYPQNVGNLLLKNVTGLTNCVTYYYRVRAVFCSGPGDNSNTMAAAPHSSGNQTFTATGASQTFTVPCGVFSLNVQLWAPGGGCGTYGHGGSGAYVTGTIAVVPNQVITLIVGKGGGGNSIANSANAGYGGGGTGYYASCYGVSGGGGGGRTAIQLTAGTDEITAGGGAGGGGYYYSIPGGGGGGGATDGVDGYFGLGGAGAGKKGTTAAGGAGGTGTQNGTSGSLTQGGNGGQNTCSYPGGGGGGGYYGGGGGAGNTSCCLPGQYGGGGGGSSFITGPNTTGGVNVQGSYSSTWNNTVNASPGAAATGYVAGVGVGPIPGGYSGIYAAGGDGEIRLSW
jgi:hypothetical protein